MSLLDDIWDDPIDSNPASNSSSAPHEPLFLADPDEENPPRPPLQHVPDIDIDIDAMFAEVEDEDDPFTIKPLTSNINIEALTREAKARHKRTTMPSSTPHAIMSSSPPRDMPDDDQTSKQKGTAKGKDGKTEKRKPMRLDEGRLLSTSGFPKLIKNFKNFKTKGKGHEVTDLNRLMQVYGYWTHEMYPKTTFRDTVERIEKLSRSKRMHVALSVWRDEAHGFVNGREPEDDSETIDLTNKADGEPAPQGSSSHGSSPVSNEAAYASSSPQPPTRPPSSGSELDDNDDFDIDAVIREEEERLAKERASSNSTINFKGKESSIAVDDDETVMWDSLDSVQRISGDKIESTFSANRETSEDDAMWAEIDALQSAKDPTPVIHSFPTTDEDDDMWDAVAEIEGEDKPRHPMPNATQEDDWDSVYA